MFVCFFFSISNSPPDIDENCEGNKIKFFKIPSFSFLNFASSLSSVVIQIILRRFLCSPNQRVTKMKTEEKCIKKAKHFRWILKAIVCLMRSCRRFSHLNNNFLNYFPPFYRLLGRWLLLPFAVDCELPSSVLLCSFVVEFLCSFIYSKCLMICNAMKHYSLCLSMSLHLICMQSPFFMRTFLSGEF